MDTLPAKHQAQVEALTKRAKEVEERLEAKDNELVLLRHAVANLQRIVEEAKKNPRK